MVAFGSFQEMWSNTLPLAVAVSAGTQGTGLGTGLGQGTGTVGVGAGGVGWPLTPNRGSHRGGTQVTFFLPSSWVFHQPLVSFGNAGATPTSSSAPSSTTPSATSSANPSNANAQSLTEAYVAYTLTTPNGTLGQVAVTIHDASYPNAPVFPLGYFR